MRDRVEQVLENVSQFVWGQFEKDLELSERVIEYVNHAFDKICHLLQFKK